MLHRLMPRKDYASRLFYQKGCKVIYQIKCYLCNRFFPEALKPADEAGQKKSDNPYYPTRLWENVQTDLFAGIIYLLIVKVNKVDWERMQMKLKTTAAFCCDICFN